MFAYSPKDKIGKRDIRHMVVPHGVVQTQRAIAVAPRVAGALVLLDDDGRHVKTFQASGQCNAALSATTNSTARRTDTIESG